MLDRKELILLKVAALLHDPPHKAWIVLGRYRAGKAPEESGDREHGLKAHEREALRLAGEILEDTPLRDAVNLIFNDVVRRADRLASSIDRVLHSSLDSDEIWGTVDLVNMFDPEHGRIRNEGKVPDRKAVEAYVRELRDALRETMKSKDYVTAYHALYALMEALWFKNVGLVGPADTRVPTHTIFDHLYATATAVNIVSDEAQGPYGGFLVLLDIAGIQSFISKARKASDYWAGSWLISAISWYLVREVIEKIGPDCLIMPTARINPFYLTWLLGKVRESYGRLARIIEDTFKNLVRYGWPRDPVIPGSLVLALPGNTLQILGATAGRSINPEEGLREYFLRRYINAWREVISAVKEGLGGDVDRALALIEDVPPMMLRVKVVKFSDVYDELLSKIGRHAEALLYHHALTKLFSKKLSETITVEPGAFLSWDEAIGKDRNYRLCSMCGKLPSVTTEELPKELKEKLLIKVEGGREERLCPYCLIKRAIRYYDGRKGVLGRVVERLVGQGVEIREGGEVVFPSVSDIATVWAKLELLRMINEVRNTEVIRALLNEIIRLLSGKQEVSNAGMPWRRGLRLPKVEEPENIGGVPAILRSMLSSIKRKWGDADPRYLLALLLVMEDAENLILGRESMLDKAVNNLGSELLSKRMSKVSKSLKRYYVILKADADSMGEVLSGRKALISYRGDWRKERESALSLYYETVLGDRVLSMYPRVKDIVRGSVKKLNEVLKEYEKRFNLKEDHRIFIPVSLSYHSCASRALMITALRDVRAVEEYGTVIYAGGDDLLAIIPAVVGVYGDNKVRPTLIDVVIRTRSAFWADTEDGFLRGAGISPALRATGRSYSLMISHYRDPMGALIEQAEEGLKRAKSAVVKSVSSKKGSDKEGVRRKDSTCIGYGRGSPKYVVIPNGTGKGSCNVLRTLEELFTMIKRGILSEGVPNDIEAWESIIKELLLRNHTAKKAVSALKYILDRNSRPPLREKVERFAEDFIQGLKDLTITVEGGAETWVPLALFRALKLMQGGDR